MQPDAFFAVRLYVPAATPVNIPVVLVYVVPFVLKVNPVSVDVTVTVPVDTAQVGCVMFAVGAAGPAGAAFITTAVVFEIQPDAFFAVKLYVPATTPVNIPVVFVYTVPLILKVKPVLIDVTVIVPDGTAHVGWVIVAVGATGFAGCAETTTLLTTEIHPPALLAVRL